MNYFDLTKKSVDSISIYETFEQNNCYVGDKKNKTQIYNGFILCDKPLVQTICEISFYPSSISGRYIPRLTFKKIDKRKKGEKETKRQFVRIEFSSSSDGYEQFWKMIGFLYQFKNLVDLEEFDKAYQVVSRDSFIVEFKNKNAAEQVKDLIRFVDEADLDDDYILQILNSSRAKTLDKFEKLLEQKDYWKTYQEDNYTIIKGKGEEAVWHHFLKTNDWIFGLNLDIRFIRDLISEPNVGTPNIEGRGNPSADFIGINDYTVLVEIKTPNTNIFTKKKNTTTSRANTWSFTSEFIDGISQCAGQKCDWDKNHKTKDVLLKNEIIDQNLTRTEDTKMIFLIGNKKREFPETSKKVDILTRRDTFQRFRRNSRNIDILTYDELYERAYNIVHQKKLNNKYD